MNYKVTAEVGNVEFENVIVVEEKVFKSLLEQSPVFDLSDRRKQIFDNLRTCENYDDFNRVIMNEADHLNIEKQLNDAYESIVEAEEPVWDESDDLP